MDQHDVVRVSRLAEFASRYQAILCDVWGVVHDGVRARPPACSALRQMRQDGSTVVLITNSPRPRQSVIEQIRTLGVPDEAYDAVVTSGDVTRALIADAPKKVFHIGTELEMALFDGLDVDLVSEEEAEIVVCTGLVNDEVEKPDDYLDLLKRLRRRELTMICANPDLVVHRGERLLYCAGALAEKYGAMGGRTRIAGKPHRPIYEKAIALASGLRGTTLSQGDILAIGDGMNTDIRGAVDHGLDSLYIGEGIHRAELEEEGGMTKLFERYRLHPTAVMTVLA